MWFLPSISIDWVFYFFVFQHTHTHTHIMYMEYTYRQGWKDRLWQLCILCTYTVNVSLHRIYFKCLQLHSIWWKQFSNRLACPVPYTSDGCSNTNIQVDTYIPTYMQVLMNELLVHNIPHIAISLCVYMSK